MWEAIYNCFVFGPHHSSFSIITFKCSHFEGSTDKNNSSILEKKKKRPHKGIIPKGKD